MCHLEVAHAVVQWEGGKVGPCQVDWAGWVGMLDEPLESKVEVRALHIQDVFSSRSRSPHSKRKSLDECRIPPRV